MTFLEKYLEYMLEKYLDIKCDSYNEKTFIWSTGYKKGFLDAMKETALYMNRKL